MDQFHDEAAWICMHLGDEYANYMGAVVPPVFQNSLHVFKTLDDMDAFVQQRNGYIYGRDANPTVEIVEKKIAALEAAQDAACFGSGMGAISAAILSCVKAGDHIVAVKNVYGPTYRFLSEYVITLGIEVTMIDGVDCSEFDNALKPNTALIYLETPCSFTLKLQDLRYVAALAKARGIKTICENTWATPIFQQPIGMGIDLSVHTASKYLGGHSDIIAGVVCGAHALIEPLKRSQRELLGAILHPQEAWLLMRGLRTLPLRMKQSMVSGIKIATYLDQHCIVDRVFYPGLASHKQYALAQKQMTGTTGLLSFTYDGTMEQARKFINALTIFKIGVSWGGFESLATLPLRLDTKEHCDSLDLPHTLIRLAIGLEDADDLIADLEQAFQASKQ